MATSLRLSIRRLLVGQRRLVSSQPTPADYPSYEIPKGESESIKKKRLLYQSRKRGISENGILLSTFADRYLHDLSRQQLDQFDLLMNHPSNEWDIYYWATGRETTPSYYDNSVMDLLKEHTQNDSKEKRYRQPDLKQTN